MHIETEPSTAGKIVFIYPFHDKENARFGCERIRVEKGCARLMIDSKRLDEEQIGELIAALNEAKKHL